MLYDYEEKQTKVHQDKLTYFSLIVDCEGEATIYKFVEVHNLENN